MIHKVRDFLLDLRDLQRMGVALSKGGAMMQARKIDLTQPATWEFSGFSQNGEDGILDLLRSQILRCNRYFIEIGASDGMQNNSSWLVVAERYNGLMIEGDPRRADRAKRTVLSHSIGAECLNMFVKRENVVELRSLALYHDPDVFSLDIDGNDYYIAQAIMDAGFRPKIFVVEYNAVYGPDASITIEYQDDFVFTKAHPTQLYYGVSIAGWRTFFERYRYKFVTVDRNGVNAFFVDPACFDPVFVAGIRGLEFADNRYQNVKFRKTSEEQFALISDQKYIAI